MFGNGSSFHQRSRYSAIEFGLIICIKYVHPVTVVIGIFGNVVSLIVFPRLWRRIDSASVQYLFLLACTDTCVLFSMGILWWLDHLLIVVGTPVHILVTNFLCKTTVYLWWGAAWLSAWIILSFSVERCVSVWAPFRRTSMTTSRRKRFLVVLVVVALVTNVELPAVMGIIRGAQTEIPHCEWNSRILPVWLRVPLGLKGHVYNHTIPWIAVLTLNIFIIIGVRRSQNAWSESKQTTGSDKNERKCIINLLAVSTVYFVFITPYNITAALFHHLARAFDGWSHPDVTHFLWVLNSFATTVSCFNYALNFVIYAFSFDKYRDEVKALFALTRKHL
ncbi:putative G-protein coupled receptor 139 [Tubulanus polymorphus]|uniref:putative G-protein coupled receptor 139 n=1 Tax=Tubulanus polymorphus TaxID=672921 RepID=UPI003DA3AB5A